MPAAADQRLLEVDEVFVLVVVELGLGNGRLFVFLASGVVVLTPAGGLAGSFIPKRR